MLVLDSILITMKTSRIALLPRSIATVVCTGVWVMLLIAASAAQTSEVQSTAPPNSTTDHQGDQNGASSKSAPTPQLRIAPGDELDISVYDVPELTQHVRVESTGDISLPLVDKIHVAGLSGAQAQEVIERALEQGGFIKNPHVAVFVKDYSNGGIIVQGQVNKPGIYAAYGQRRLSDMLLQAGGTTQTAGDKISVTRPGQPAPMLVSLSENPAKVSEFIVLPGDTISVGKAGIVYVLGEVTRPGGFVLQNSEEGQPAGLSAIQAMALASGPTRTASLNKARIIRRTPKGLEQFSLPLKKIMEGKDQDPQLQAEDIVYVPNSRMKSMSEQAPASLVAVLASAAIYRF
jgi:polysaccharide biosynthesis/export protein